MTLSLAALATEPSDHFELDQHPTWDDLFELRRYLQLGLADLLDDWDVGSRGPLRLTKGRIRTTAICPAQVLAEIDPFSINFNIAVGIVCDAAAGVLALHPAFAAHNGWYQDLEPSLRQEHPHLTEFIDGLGAHDRVDFHHVVDDLCGSLPELLGDLRPHRPTVHHRIASAPVPGLLITGEVDLGVDAVFGPDEGDAEHIEPGAGGHTTPGATGRRARILAEVKSGGFNPRISDELAHYALITNLQQLPSLPVGPSGGPEVRRAGHPPSAGTGADGDRSRAANPRAVLGCAVSLGDLGVTPVPLGTEILETAARRILETTASLVEINHTVQAGGSPPTNPGDHCRWCRRVALCPDAPDLVLAELTESLRPLHAKAFDPAFDDSRFDGDEFSTGLNTEDAET